MSKKSLIIAVAASLASLSVAVILHGRHRDREAAPEGWLGREAAAAYWLRKLASAQSRVKSEGIIDVDGDGIGEFATLLELNGAVGVRRGFIAPQGDRPSAADFSMVGEPLDLTSAEVPVHGLPDPVDAEGMAAHGGYLYRVFLPDNGTPAGWTHETGPSGAPGFAGGTGRVGIDGAEGRWCAVAWPVTRGESGDRVYFVDETGVILESGNTVARWSGPLRAPTPDCAQSSAGTGSPASPDGRVGRDGDRWTPWDPARLSTRLKEPRKR